MAAFVTHQELAVDKVVPRHLLRGEQILESLAVRGVVAKEAKPNGSIDEYQLGDLASWGRLFTTPRHVLGVRFRATKRPQALIGCVTDQHLQPQTHRFRICRGATRGAGVLQQLRIDVQGLLHTSQTTIQIWPFEPYRLAPRPLFRKVTLPRHWEASPDPASLSGGSEAFPLDTEGEGSTFGFLWRPVRSGQKSAALTPHIGSLRTTSIAGPEMTVVAIKTDQTEHSEQGRRARAASSRPGGDPLRGPIDVQAWRGTRGRVILPS